MSRLLSVLLVGICFVYSIAPSELNAQTVGPPRSSIPDWAHPGQVHYSCWDGGPLETCKAFLSGWPDYNPPKVDYLYVMTNWYHPSTIRFLRQGGINLVYMNLCIGYSIPAEEFQRKLVREYIEQCRPHDIHVIAYEDATNIFEDMLAQVPEARSWLALGKDGKPIGYECADYTRTGRITRYLADISKPGWREYTKKRIDLAIEAGADGIVFDNTFATDEKLVDFFQEMVPYALGKKKQFLLTANFHAASWNLYRMFNTIISEDTGEVGVFYEKNIQDSDSEWVRNNSNRWLGERDTMVRVDGGYLVTNIGRLRVFENLSEGWKPVMAESCHREVGTREMGVMKPERYQLAVAEMMMFNISHTPAAEGRTALGLWRSEPETMQAWSAMGDYNRFFAGHQEYLRNTKSVATLAVVLDNASQGTPILNAIASRGILFNVLYEHELTPEKLKPYAAVALLTAKRVRDQAVSSLESYVADGGKVFIAGNSASEDENGTARKRPAWFGQELGKGECTYWEHLPPFDELAATLRAADRPPLVRVEAPTGVLYNVRQQPETGRLMVHLLNYLPRPANKVKVIVQGKHEQVKLVTPDDSGVTPRTIRSTDEATEIEVPRVKIYSLLALEPER